jgi:hypothetical protein
MEEIKTIVLSIVVFFLSAFMYTRHSNQPLHKSKIGSGYIAWSHSFEGQQQFIWIGIEQEVQCHAIAHR